MSDTVSETDKKSALSSMKDVFSKIETYVQSRKLYEEGHKNLRTFEQRAFESIEKFLEEYQNFTVIIKSNCWWEFDGTS